MKNQHKYLTEKQRHLKALAEKYIISNKPLTLEEYNELKGTQWGRRVKYTSGFEQLVEDMVEADEQEEKEYPTPFTMNLGIDRRVVKELLDNIEEHFGLGVYDEDDEGNYRVGRYSSINPAEVVQYVKDFFEDLDDNRRGGYTEEHILDRVGKHDKSLLKIMGCLRYCLI